MPQLNRGGYSQEVPVPVVQHKYKAGGHPGCGAYVEVIDLDLPGVGRRFVLQEYIDDIDGQRYRFREYQHLEHAVAAWEQSWPQLSALTGCERYTKPYWELATKQALLVCEEHAAKNWWICACPAYKEFLWKPKDPYA